MAVMLFRVVNRYLITGWPGSAHDQRVLRNSNMRLRDQEYFGATEYILGDSAYTPHATLIPSYKNLPNQPFQPIREHFNLWLAKARIVIEHTIGILHTKFQSLKCIRREVVDGSSVSAVVKHIEACVILHNLCTDDLLPAEWIELELDDVAPGPANTSDDDQMTE